eukprot:gb/GECH01015025.1/.p1 GENE.gb/GECH01015025.1/~~gb/GECH01015025.1/.p1  ORF type:complete len:366 (+),score=76.76 gb/GECH01015025.1/:1-1098(+)
MSSQINPNDSSSVYNSVQNYYGKVLNNKSDLKTNACTSSPPHPIIRDALKSVPEEIKNKYYGCGTPIPFGIEGLNVLDLGSGSGRDCYITAKLVGPQGMVTGVDMTQEQLDVANRHIEEYTVQTLSYPKPNLRFVQGYMECLDETSEPIESNSQDLVISNCVLNLSPDKEKVLKQVYRVLKNGGEFYFSDVYCDRRLPEHVRQHEVLFGECIAGALYIEDFKRICHKVGFLDPRSVSLREIKIRNPELKDVVGEARFYSVTYRLFKVDGLETKCEDYGQYTIYRGTIPGHKHSYDLDDGHHFVTGKPALVCGNTAAMLSESWLSPYFEVHGNRDVHYGLFDCHSSAAQPAADNSGSCSTGGGGCC